MSLHAPPDPCPAPPPPPGTAIRPDPARKSAVQYRIYCALHSAAQQARDEKAWQERLEKAAQQQQVGSRGGEAGVGRQGGAPRLRPARPRCLAGRPHPAGLALLTPPACHRRRARRSRRSGWLRAGSSWSRGRASATCCTRCAPTSRHAGAPAPPAPPGWQEGMAYREASAALAHPPSLPASSPLTSPFRPASPHSPCLT